MTDREKVILGFECHFRWDGKQCPDCPYWKNIRDTCKCQRELEEDAHRILKEDRNNRE